MGCVFSVVLHSELLCWVSNRLCLCLSPLPSVYCSLVLLCKCKCLTAGLLSSRHIHRSAAHSPGSYPEAVWVSEQERSPACCVLLCFYALCDATRVPISLTNRASGQYMSVSVSACNSTSTPLAYLSCVGLGDCSHICGNR